MEVLFVWAVIAIAIWCALKLCGMPASFNLLPLLLPGEKVLFVKRWVWAGSAGPPSMACRFWIIVPLLLEQGVYVTDRRVLHVFHILRIIKQEQSQWFEGRQEAGDNDLVKSVNCGRNRLSGPYLEILSENLQAKRWWQSPKVRLRLFMRNPGSIRKIIAETMARTY